MSSDSDDSDYDDAPAIETSNRATFTIDKTHPQIITLVGSPRSGKSTFLKAILYRYAYQEKFFKSGLIFCPSDDGDLEEWIDEKYVITTYTEEALLGYIDKLRKKQHEKRKELEKAGCKKKYILPPNFLVLDDLSQGLINWYSPGIANWLSRFRKTNTWVFITSQYLNQGSSTALREYTSIFVFFAQKTTNALNGAYRATGGAMFENKKEFFKVLREITDKEYTALVFAEENPPDKRVFSFKCELPPEGGWKITFGKDERGRQQRAKEHGNSSAQNAIIQNNILDVIDSAIRRYESRAWQ